MSIKDHCFVVTGGAVARSILKSLAAAGAKVVAVDRTQAHADLAADTGAWPLGADLSSFEGALAMAHAITDKLGAVDGLIHTVGGFAMGPLAESDPTLYDKMFDLNVKTL